MANRVKRQRCSKNGLGGFTLIELLVVIAIIALLISILLPALGEVRRQGKIIVCRSNMRQLVMAFTTYGNDYKDAIPGSPTTSGADALKGKFNGTAMQSWDWMGPIASQLGYNSLSSSDNDDEPSRAERFNLYREQMKVGICTENNILAVPYPNAKKPWTAGRMISYNVSTQFVSTEAAAPEGTGNRKLDSGIDRKAYRPFYYRMGTPHMKAMVYEGSRYCEWDENTSSQPDFEFSINASFGGAFADTGPWFNGSTPNRSLVRTVAPGEDIAAFVTSKFDPRRYAFRHGSKAAQSTSSTQVLGHLAFLDGHVEIMDDIKATNPDYWFPTGTTLGVNKKQLPTWKATRKNFPDKVGGSAGEYLVP